MMKLTKYMLLPGIMLLCLLAYSCNDDFEQGNNANTANNYIRVNGTPKGFSEVDVSTRSAKNEFDVKLSTLYMLIFDSDGELVGFPQFNASGVPSFIIDTHSPPYSTHDQAKLEQCDIFFVGNLNDGDLADIRTLEELNNYEIEASTIHPDTDPAFKGLVMIGKTANKVNLSSGRPSGDANILEISMVSIYAKVVVNLQLQPEQNLPGKTQNFRMSSWEVVNAPRYATLGSPEAKAETRPSKNEKLPSNPSGLHSGSNPVGVSQSLSYTFYMLEHKRNIINNITYPEGINESAKQRFKPKLVNEDTDAVYMLLNGTYLDHQGITHQTTYKLYLGANAVDDFYILRDNQYNNHITIKGVTSNNSFDESTVSFDARVTVDSGPVWITVKRDTQLDSHFEVRPLDIHVSPGYTVNVKVEDAAQIWIGLDRETVADGKVVKRDYFTTDLISTLPKSYNGFKSDFRVWAYFDENSTTTDRTGKIIFTLTETATNNVTELIYTFLQKGLFEVTYNGHTYYIEFHEEYLHNFDPNDPYNNTTDGMFWGLDGIRFSYLHDAFRFNGAFEEDINNSIKRLLGDHLGSNSYSYDFYTPLDQPIVGTDGVTINTRSGNAFTRQIVERAGIGPLKLTETASSAVEYCYNKNKRNASGDVPVVNWYLPAIDEIEDIVMGAYGTFQDFQNKYYWSSQPAYIHNYYYYRGLAGLNSGDGVFFTDNLQNARATKVDYQNSNYVTVNSGMSDYQTRYNFKRNLWGFTIGWDNPREQSNPTAPTNDPGNQSRGNINRIRCVYMVN